MLTLISDILHYSIVLDLVNKAKYSLWIGTTDIQDLYVMYGKPECKKYQQRKFCPDPRA